MHDLVSSTEEMHYENFRISRLTLDGLTDDDPVVRARKIFEAKMREEEETLKKRFTVQVRMEENRFRAWEQKVKVSSLGGLGNGKFGRLNLFTHTDSLFSPFFQLMAERDRLNSDLEEHHRVIRSLKEILPQTTPQ